MVLNHQSTSRSSVFHFYDVTLYSEVLLLKFSRFINVTDLLYSWIFKLLFRVSLKKEITSRIHRITQPLQLERISGYPLVQPHYSKEGHPLKQIAKDHGQPGFEYLHSWRIHNLSRNLFQGLTILMVKKIFLIFKLYFFYFSLCPLPLARSLRTLRRVRLHLLHTLSAAGVQAETFLAAHLISLQVGLILPNLIPAYSKRVSILPSGHLTLLPPLECLPLMLKVFQEYHVHHAFCHLCFFLCLMSWAWAWSMWSSKIKVDW